MVDATPQPFVVRSGELELRGDHWPATGSGSGTTPALLLHGGGQTRHSWDRTAAALASRGREVYTLDARGHGDSSWAADGNYGLEGFVDDLRNILSTSPAKPVVIGASLGGITALCTAGEDEDAVAALVMVDVVVDVEQKGIDRIKAFMTDHVDGFDTLDDVADAIAAYNPARQRTKNLEGLKKNVRQREDGRWYWHWDPEFIHSGEGDEPRRHTDPVRLAAAARQVSVPTLVVRGGKSDVVSDAGIASMKRLVPHAEIADVSGAGHMVAGDDNEVFAAAIEAFLDRNGL
ncbi:alpha/beta fold hydrolase [Gordonia sp. (in: high G+C Gram-positive bacteria)]|uniref:alpha/beta fold hydrolase n=1 Tax=Gordonia sp. (in: high G+C Gram-positive bacteria) TaxID=84139 RepID=UPI003C74E375